MVLETCPRILKIVNLYPHEKYEVYEYFSFFVYKNIFLLPVSSFSSFQISPNSGEVFVVNAATSVTDRVVSPHSLPSGERICSQLDSFLLFKKVNKVCMFVYLLNTIQSHNSV